DKASAYLTLYEVLVELAKLIAPIVPFLAEEIYQNLVRQADSTAHSSVHHCHYPDPDQALVDERLESAMNLVQRVVEFGRAARSASKVKVRQPLPALRVALGANEVWPPDPEFTEHVKDELNVKAVILDEADRLAERSFRPTCPSWGPSLGPSSRRSAKPSRQARSRPSPEVGGERPGWSWNTTTCWWRSKVEAAMRSRETNECWLPWKRP